MKGNLESTVFSQSFTRLGLLVGVPVAVVFGVQALSWGEATPPPVRVAAEGSPWVECGDFNSLLSLPLCEVPGFPVDEYEYGFKHNSAEVWVADCLFWNVGIRIVNRHPYLMGSDNPIGGNMALGGTIFYTGTTAPDDDLGAPSGCTTETPWRQRYWRIDDDDFGTGDVSLISGNGCFNRTLYCRLR